MASNRLLDRTWPGRSVARPVRARCLRLLGTTKIRGPRGEATRFNLFDCSWDNGKDSLRGQEEVQASIYRLISNFAREGRTNRLILLHGPNGSAKSTVVACIERAMEHYSHLDEGALYRFSWIFPVQNVSKGASLRGSHASIGDATRMPTLRTRTSNRRSAMSCATTRC